MAIKVTRSCEEAACVYVGTLTLQSFIMQIEYRFNWKDIFMVLQNYCYSNEFCFLVSGCNCSSTGSIAQTCDQRTGQCKCKTNFAGLNCDHCKPNFYMYQYKCVGK